jgi:hypothetical protein
VFHSVQNARFIETVGSLVGVPGGRALPKERLRVSSNAGEFLHVDCRLAIRLSLPKGEGRVRVALYSGAPKTPHLNPLPFLREGRGGKISLRYSSARQMPVRLGPVAPY